jgi:hypothetical protein
MRNKLPNHSLLQTPHTLVVGRAGLRQRGRLWSAARQKLKR